jgi:glycosyltransferase involved in cell wall biosynthesis
MSERPNVLVLSRNYPNSILTHQGPWVQRQTSALARLGCAMTVLAPSPYWPPIPGPTEIVRMRQIERFRREDGFDVHHPRFLVGPGQSTAFLEAAATYASIARRVARLHRRRPFDVIHAHFSYPDGVVAVMLGRRLRIPVVVTEHVLWKPWMSSYPLVRRQAVWGLERAAAFVPVSHAVRRSMNEYIEGLPTPTHVIPVGVDGHVFQLKPSRVSPKGERLLFVGWINYIKGMDVLIDSLSAMVRRGRRVGLTIVGGALFRHKQRQQDELLRKVEAAGLAAHVSFAGPQDAAGVARYMRESDVLVLPSRRESCGSVLLEALASGTPVVATRCGGPEELVTDDVGVLVPVDDPAALASGIERVLDGLDSYEPEALREYALSNFSWERLAERYLRVYDSVCQ